LDAKRNVLGNQLTKKTKNHTSSGTTTLDLQQQALDSIIEENDEKQKQKVFFNYLKIMPAI
jgi:hypothetical protein